MGKRWSKEIKAEALRLLARGYSVSAIAKHLDVPRSTVAGWKREALKRGELESEEIGMEEKESLEGVDSQISLLLARLEREMLTIDIKSAKDLKDLSAAVGSLVTARAKWNLSRRGKVRNNGNTDDVQGFTQNLSTRELAVLTNVLGKAKGSSRLEDITQEEVDSLTEKVKNSNLRGANTIIAKLRSWKPAESQEDQPSEE